MSSISYILRNIDVSHILNLAAQKICTLTAQSQFSIQPNVSYVTFSISVPEKRRVLTSSFYYTGQSRLEAKTVL